jgi:two-component system sensor histidine kinase MprB
MSIRTRIALLTTLAVALVEVAIVASLYVYASNRLYAKVEDDLRRTAATLGAVVGASGDLPTPASPQGRAQSVFVPRLVAADGRVLTARTGLDLPVTAAARAVASGARASALETLPLAGDDYYVLSVPAGQGRALQVSHSLTTEEDVLNQLLTASIVIAAVGLVLAPLTGASVATGALGPLRRLSRVTDRVTRTGDLTQRVSVGGRDEVASFARSFDAMLDRLEGMVAELDRAQRAQRQLVADASHELRAPLTTLRANIELLGLGADPRDADRRELISDTLAGIDDLTSLVAQVIELAREDERVHERVPVQLDQIVSDELERVRHRYPEVTFASSIEPTTVLGDAQALGRAVANLLDNAGKWSPAGGTVRADLKSGVLDVRDEGPGIDPNDLPHIFERFYRGARAGAVPGSGLGLAIVAQVMRSHGGEVSAKSPSTGGTLFRARFISASS